MTATLPGSIGVEDITGQAFDLDRCGTLALLTDHEIHLRSLKREWNSFHIGLSSGGSVAASLDAYFDRAKFAGKQLPLVLEWALMFLEVAREATVARETQAVEILDLRAQIQNLDALSTGVTDILGADGVGALLAAQFREEDRDFSEIVRPDPGTIPESVDN